MDNENWNEFDALEVQELAQERKAKIITRKRKWREIESIKEQRRLRRELSEYEYAHY
jgi:hypothetical protein